MTNHSAAAKAFVDDELFTRLLEAAYVIQEQQKRVCTKPTPADFPQIVTKVLDIQRLIHSQEMALRPALNLVASRLREFTGAAGVAIGRVQDKQLNYLVAQGSAGVLANSSIAVHASSSSQCLSTGQCVKSYATEHESRSDLEVCRRLGARSFFAVPVFHDSTVAGAVELFFSSPDGFNELDIRIAELLAGVVMDVFVQATERELKQALAAERASVLMALESIKPQLHKLVGEERPPEKAATSTTEAPLCRACGHAFMGEETYCAVCGASRATGKYPGTELQGKWAALWERQMIDVEHGPSFRRTAPAEAPAVPAEEPASFDLEVALDDLQPEMAAPAEADIAGTEEDAAALVAREEAISQAIEPVTDISEHPEWKSAQRAREWLSAHIQNKPWNQPWTRMIATRRGDVSLLLAGIVFAVVIVWGVWPQPAPTNTTAVATVSAVKRRVKPRPRQLSWSEKLLVNLGLAIPPPPPQYMGNPNTRVWVDLQNGLYYCPGTPLYGATPKGRYTSQFDAQQDQFEPAARVPCE